MTLIISKTLDVMPMTDLMYTALEYVYEKDRMPVQKIRWMMDSVVAWTKLLAHREPEELTAIQKEYLHTLQDVAKLLQSDEEGKLEKRKRQFRRHGISWRKFHRLPGAVTAEDKAKAEAMKAEYDRQNPEQEDRGKIDKDLDFLHNRKAC